MKSAQTQAWADHLRSTTKSQGHGYLALRAMGTDKVAYCCMGLGCTLIPSLRMEGAEDGEIFSFGGHTKYPPMEFLRWLGFTTLPRSVSDAGSTKLKIDWPLVSYPLTQGKPGEMRSEFRQHDFNLDFLNDTVRLTFDQIGDLIAYFGVKGAWEE